MAWAARLSGPNFVRKRGSVGPSLEPLQSRGLFSQRRKRGRTQKQRGITECGRKPKKQQRMNLEFTCWQGFVVLFQACRALLYRVLPVSIGCNGGALMLSRESLEKHCNTPRSTIR